MAIIHKKIKDGATWEWDGVTPEGYGPDGSVVGGASRHILVGKRDGAEDFVIRYFTVPPGGTSNLDEHPHDHGVVVMNGRATFMHDDNYEEVVAGDVIYIPNWERHQFINMSDDEPFAFLCIIPPKEKFIGEENPNRQAQAAGN